jgi:plasmid stabilization system protein ParE
MIIVWSDEAIRDFEENLIFLSEEWNVQVVLDFTEETERILHVISEMPKAFRHYRKNIHAAPVTQHITLFYRIGRDKIELIRFWNNYRSRCSCEFIIEH